MSKRQSKIKGNDKIVIIKPIAYYKMLVHTLRFGNRVKDRRKYKEVMGILIGRLEGEANQKGVKNVIIEDAVAISHGGTIEVAFAPGDYVSFSVVDAEYAERDPPLFSCGWYHSHPGLNIFFSGTDIKNQLGWQTPNPSAIGIVFDHTYLKNPGDLGFRTFRLDDPSKGPKSGYYEVNTVVEPPDSLEYYIKIKELINSVHSKEPLILEINEMPYIFGEISFPEESQLISPKPILQLTDIFSALQNGISKFLHLSMEPLIGFLNNWSQEIVKNIMENNLEMRADLAELSDNIHYGVKNLQNNYKNSISNKLNQLDVYIDDRFDDFEKDRNTIKNVINLMKEELNEKINNLFEEKINISISEKLKLLDESSNKLSEINQINRNSIESIKKKEATLKTLSERIKSIENLTLNKLKSKQEGVIKTFTEKVNNIAHIIADLNKETKFLLSELDTSISTIENSTQLINTLKTEKEELKKQIEQNKRNNDNLQKQMKDLEAQKQDLLNKIKKLERGGA